MRWTATPPCGLLLAVLALAGWMATPAAVADDNSGDGTVAFHSPGLPPTVMNAQGDLQEDWGTVGIALSVAGLPDAESSPTPTVQALTLDEVIPAAQATTRYGPVVMTRTAYRAPIFPAGVDVLTVRLEETSGQDQSLSLEWLLPETAQIGHQTARAGDRIVATLPPDAAPNRELRDWGSADEAVAMPGWARPAVPCDPAFQNIRAGMGGVPIVYRFRIEPGSEAQLALGFCESHWSTPGQRPLACRVEGAPEQQIDPIAAWGQHQPGALLFRARDVDGDGWIETSVRSTPGASDANPILNALWIFPSSETLDLAQLVAGQLNAAAIHYVDVGGDNDQSIYPPGKLVYQLDLPARGERELTFLIASPGGSSPIPGQTTWTPATLRQAAQKVWRDWPRTDAAAPAP